jgi:hypothetical protein
MYKDFPNSRVCAIDYYPYFLEALKETYQIAKKYNIPFKAQGKGSTDIQKFFYHYCLEKFCSGYKKCSSRYPKAFVFYPLPKGVVFNNKSLDKLIKVLPIAWVKCSSFDSPDVETAVLGVINKNKNNKQKILNFANKHFLYDIIKKQKNSKYFSTGSVDLSDDN